MNDERNKSDDQTIAEETTDMNNEDTGADETGAAKGFPKFDIVFDDAVETITVAKESAGDADDEQTTGKTADGQTADAADVTADDAAAPSESSTDTADDKSTVDGEDTSGDAGAADGTAAGDGNVNAIDADTIDELAAEAAAAGIATVEAEHAAASIDRNADDDSFTFRSYPTLALKHASYAPDRKSGDVLHDVNFEFHARRFYSIWAQSDAERIAITGLLSGLMGPTDGKVMFKSQELHELTPLEYRGHFMGLIPQRFALREDLSAVQNLVMTMEASGRNFLKARPILAAEQLESVGFPEEKNDKPVRDLLEVEKRKAAIARALICEATVILADEPTGQLGEQAADDIIQLLRRLTRRDDHCVILVTEDKATAETADIMYRL